MKKTFALLACLSALPAYAQSTVTLYGSVDMSLTHAYNGQGTTLPGGGVATAGSARTTSMASGVGPGSRLGFRGREDLGGGLHAFFTAEMGIAYNNGSYQQGGLAFGRQALVGIGGTNWTISAGRQYSPHNLAFGGSDAMHGLWWGNPVAASGHALYPSIGSVGGSGTHNATARIDNSILGTYKWGAVTGKLMVATGNGNSLKTGQLVNPTLNYSQGPWTLNASYLRMRTPASMLQANEKPEWMTEWLVGGGYNFGFMRLYGGFYEFKGPQDKSRLSAVATVGAVGASPFAYSWDKTRSIWVSANIPIGTGKLLLAASRQTYHYSSGTDGRSYVLGATYEHPISKRTSFYVSGAVAKNNERARTPLIATITAVVPAGYGSDLRAFSVGMQHRF